MHRCPFKRPRCCFWPDLTRDSNEWEDAGSNCTDQFDDALPVNRTGTVDRTTVGSYTLTYDCMQNSEDVILATQ